MYLEVGGENTELFSSILVGGHIKKVLVGGENIELSSSIFGKLSIV